MGSFKANGREQGPNRRRDTKAAKRRGFLNLESLETRTLLDAGAPSLTPLWKPTSTDLKDVAHGPMANVGSDLINVYQSFLTRHGDASSLPQLYPDLQFKGTSVGVGLKSLGGDFNDFIRSLTNLGMQITTSSPYYGLVEGYLPISQLPAVAMMPQVMSGFPSYKPHTSFQGIANNQAETSTFANQARQQLGVDGTGVMVGVLSDSVNQFGGGLASSYSTGDLPNNGVTVISDGAAGSSDEGRAMLENIYDIAPGASLSFATGFGSITGFANNIRALRSQANARVIVDDIGYLFEPSFQDGIIAQGVNDVVNQGAVYLSAAGNSADAGYLSTFRSATGTVPGVNSGQPGTFMNFNPSGTLLQLPLTTTGANASFSFQYDQPFNVQQPAGSTAQVTSNLDVFVIDANGTVVASGIDNNVATQAPFEYVTVPSAGSYTVAVQVVSGSAPGHIQMIQWNSSVSFSKQFGNAGGTYYPTSYGHSTAINTIGVGAVPWWAPSPYLGQTPLASEPFSSFGPAIYVLNPNGTPISGGAKLVQNPAVTAPDGGNTTFFPPGGVIDTSNPPFPGQPATSTNLSQNLPSFFGTSSAAPNAAAVAALMIQKVPQLTPAQVRQGLIDSATATPMNGEASGTWNVQGGYGLINAIRAVNAVDVLRVATTNPANGATVTTSPSAIMVTFSKQVDLATVNSSNLVFQNAPAGVTVLVGAPRGVDDPRYPTTIAFPFSFSYSNPPTTTANGDYTFAVQGAIKSRDGKDLVPSNPISFKLSDTTAPVVSNTVVFSRVVTIQFNKAMNPATITAANLFVQRTGKYNPSNPNAPADWTSPINLNNSPQATISFDPLSNTATLDYSGLAQTSLPSDFYRIVVKSGPAGATDLVGNQLDGEYNGVFPSGDKVAGGDFVQSLGLQLLQAPVITSFQMTAATDAGIAGDQNTNIVTPRFVGQVYNSFPGTVANLQVYIQFNGLHSGAFDLGVGGGSPPRGLAPGSSPDVIVTTDASGKFEVPAPPLPEGFQRAMLVVVGEADQPPLPGYSSALLRAFRVDSTPPQVTGASLTPGGATLPLPGGPGSPTAVSQLTALSLNVVDYANPSTGYLGTPYQVLFPAIDPATASNISNYSLILNRGTPGETDQSSFITSAIFVAAAPILDNSGNPPTIRAYQGRIDLTIAPGLPAGIYTFIAHTAENGVPGLKDAAGNALDETFGQPIQPQKSFILQFNIQPTPVFVSGLGMNTTNPDNSVTISGPRSFFEIPSTDPNYPARATAPPTSWTVDLSNPIPFSIRNPDGSYTPIDYSNKLQLIRAANAGGNTPDGEFGNLGQSGLGSTGTGFTIFSNTGNSTVSLVYKDTNGNWQNADDNNPGTRLVLALNQGVTLPVDNYRLYLPNQVEPGAIDTRIYDIFGNQLDGEFLGNQTPSGGWEDLLPTGQYRVGLSGDLVAGGAFMTGFVVVPTGNILYARPDYQEDPFVSDTAPDGSRAKPYSTLAPEGDPSRALDNPTHDPNGGLNSSQFFLSGFNASYDRNGNGRFDRSAFYAAAQLSYRGPVVIIALPGTPQRDPITGLVSQQTFVLQAPAGANSIINNGSASVPFNTTLAFDAGSTLKFQNATLFVQNQGSALQALGGSSATGQVNFTSYADDSIGGDTNRDGANTRPRGGDWGGIVFRSYDNSTGGRNFSFAQGANYAANQYGSGPMVGLNGAHPLSGADETLSLINFAAVRYGGGAVPQTSGTRFDGIETFNSRPAITNTLITHVGQNVAQAAISVDMDSLRQDDVAAGVLVRRTSVIDNGLNGIWLRPNLSGVVQVTNALPNLQDNPLSLGGAQNYVLNSPLPYLLVSRMVVGVSLNDQDPQKLVSVRDRLYIQPGMMLKFQRGAGIEIRNGFDDQGFTAASLVVGDRTYIAGFDSQSSFDPNFPGTVTSSYGPQPGTNPLGNGYRPPTVGDAQVLFTSLYDYQATTYYSDPITGQQTIIVPAIDSANSANDPRYQLSPGNVPELARWGSLTIESGAQAVINEAIFRYGGGTLNVAGGTETRTVLTFAGASTLGLGTRVYITDNEFDDNADAPMSITPNGLLAADSTRPVASGKPFFRGNILKRNGVNGLVVYGASGLIQQAGGEPTLGVDSVWDNSDLAYIVRNTIVLSGRGSFGFDEPTFDPTQPSPIVKPLVTLTVQSILPDTVLADGSIVPRPGISPVIKLGNAPVPAPTPAFTQGANLFNNVQGGAGFMAGVDNGVDPTTDATIDIGAFSQMRFLGIPANETTGQQRVPVIITSIHDNTAGFNVRGVPQFSAIDGDTTAPSAGDGGLIYFGGNTVTSFNVFDPRQGNIIDNVDAKYLSRIEVQGGGIIRYIELGTDTAFDANDLPDFQKAGNFPNLPNGQPDPRNWRLQYNANKVMTISNSNLSNFRDFGVITHPGFNQLVINANPQRSGLAGQSTGLFMYNTTVSNMPTGVQMLGDPGSNTVFPDRNEFLSLHNTFYNNQVAINLQAQTFNNTNGRAHVHFVGMNNIFANNVAGLQARALGNAPNSQGMMWGSVAQYNLFWQNGTDWEAAGVDSFIPNQQPIFGGDPKFRSAATGDFRLLPGSAAIDAARSEMNLNPTSQGAQVALLIPIMNQVDTSDVGIRNNNRRIGDNIDYSIDNVPTNFLTLPGYPQRGYLDEWNPVQPGTAGSSGGPTSNGATWNFLPVEGERDQNGYLRLKDPNSSNVGFGSRPFFDIGAYEYRELSPPHVTGVTAILPGVQDPINFYSVGGVAGANTTPTRIMVTFDKQIDPNTITAQTVLIQASGGDGIFGNNNNASDRFINLAGKLSFDSVTNSLIINLGGSGLNLSDDAYRIHLLGSGSNVIRDPQGTILDGENTDPKSKNDPNNPQLELPSGDGFPGGNFYDTFVINSTPSDVAPGTFHLAAQSDTNIVGDNITSSTLPSFVGTITVANPTLVPVSGQTAIVDIGLETSIGTFFPESSNIPPEVLPYLRLNAGTATTDTNGSFTVVIGQDLANTGLVTVTSGLAHSPYNVGTSGRLVPLPGTVHGYYVARLRVIDQSGNQSDPSDTNAQAPFVVDNTSPTVTLTNPTNNSVIGSSSQPYTFTVAANENLDQTHFTPTQIQLLKSAPDGSFTSPGVTPIAINPNVTFVFLDQGTGGTGRQQIQFSTTTPLANGLYRLTLVTTGVDAIRDIAGNNAAGSDILLNFAVFDPTNVHGVFVGASSYVTDATVAQGLRANPFPTVAAALAAASVGDRLALLPGVYTERVTLKPFVSLASADVSSTDASYVPGNALDTIIRAPATSGFTSNITVSAAGLSAFTGQGATFRTEISGLTIASPLVGDPALGPINPESIALQVTNSNILVTKSYFIDAGTGIWVITSGDAPMAPTIINSGPIGNITGIVIQDAGSSVVAPTVQVVNNTFAFNTTGLMALNSSATGSRQVFAANNIFWQNHSQGAQRTGVGVTSQTLNKVVLNNNMFSGNGASDVDSTGATSNIGNGFDPNKLGPASSDALANLGNYVGYPSFVAPRDPRPGSDGPATFLRDANFGLTATSAAINNGLETAIRQAVSWPLDSLGNPIVTDFLGNRENAEPTNKGFGIPGYGPRDVGAFEHVPTGTVGTNPVGGSFRVVTTSLVPDGAGVANGSTLIVPSSPTSVIVNFSRDVNRATVDATDLILSGTNLRSLSPVRATSVTWLDDHTAQFNLTGQFTSGGTVNISLAPGSVQSRTGAALTAYADKVIIDIKPPATPPVTTNPPATTNPPVTTNPPATTNPPKSTKPATPPPAHAPTKPPARRRVVKAPRRRVIKTPRHKVVQGPRRKVAAPPKHKAVAKPRHKVVAKPRHKVVATPVHKLTGFPAPSRKIPTFPGKPR